MSTIDGQSTDRIPIDTNPYTPRVLARGHGTITTSPTGGGIGYFTGTLTVDLSAYDFSTIVPEAEVYVEGTSGDLSTLYLKAPYVQPSGTLTADSKIQLSGVVSYALARGNAKTAEIHGTSYTLQLRIYYFSSSNTQSVTVHWQIKSTEAGPF